MYYSTDSIVSDEADMINRYPVEFLNTIKTSGLPPHCLKLKIGCIVMLIRNINVSEGLVNGLRLKVTKMYENSIEAEILCGKNTGQKILLPRINMIPSDTDYEFSFQRRQLPVILAFAITINKSQGQTFRKVGIYLPNPVFNHGQLYVALSRATRAEYIKVKIEHAPPSFVTENIERQLHNDEVNYTSNIVFKQLIQKKRRWTNLYFIKNLIYIKMFLLGHHKN